jgi:hypothetical protein
LVRFNGVSFREWGVCVDVVVFGEGGRRRSLEKHIFFTHLN